MTLEIYNRDRALLKAVLAAGYALCCQPGEIEIRRVENLVEALRRQLSRPPQENVRHPVRPPVATTGP